MKTLVGDGRVVESFPVARQHETQIKNLKSRKHEYICFRQSLKTAVVTRNYSGTGRRGWDKDEWEWFTYICFDMLEIAKILINILIETDTLI